MASFVHLRRYSTTFSRTVLSLKSTAEHLTGHSDVLRAQELVREQKAALQKWRNELHFARTSYESIQQDLRSLYARKTQVYQDQRRDLSALQAIHAEEETLLYQEQTLISKVESCRQKERESFEGLSDAIQQSHEKERAQSERMKYYSRLGSIMGAVFGFLGSNLFLRREVRVHNKRQVEAIEHMEVTLQNMQLRSTDASAEGKAAVEPVESLEAQCTKELERKLEGGSTRVLESQSSHFSSSDVLVVGIVYISVLAALLASCNNVR